MESYVSGPPRVVSGVLRSINAATRTVSVFVGLDADGNERLITARIPGTLTVGQSVPVLTSDAGAIILTTG